MVGWTIGYYGPRPASAAQSNVTQKAPRSSGEFSHTRSSTAVQHPSLAAAAPAGNLDAGAPAISLSVLSESERTEDLELIRRESQGDYVLSTDHNLHRRRVRQIVSNIVEKATQQVTPRYTAKLTELGVDPATTESVIQHLSKIREASLRAEDPLRTLANARQDLEKRLTTLLSPESYQEFKRFEQTQRGRRDLEEINNEWARVLGARLSPERETQLLNLMNSSGAYSEPPQHGLYDGLPATATGRSAVREMMTSVVTNLERSYPAFIAEAERLGLLSTELGILRTHYQQRLASLRSSVERLRQPDVEEEHQRPQ